MEIFFVIILILVIAIILLIVNLKKEIKQLPQLKQNYEEALRGVNKRAALNAGRAYYSALRGGKISIYDETAMGNDLAAMSS